MKFIALHVYELDKKIDYKHIINYSYEEKVTTYKAEHFKQHSSLEGKCIRWFIENALEGSTKEAQQLMIGEKGGNSPEKYGEWRTAAYDKSPRATTV